MNREAENRLCAWEMGQSDSSRVRTVLERTSECEEEEEEEEEDDDNLRAVDC